MFDAATLRHLDRWLQTQTDNPDCRDAVRDAMLATAAGDPEHWADVGWPKLFDAAGADAIVMRFARHMPTPLFD